MYSLFIPPEKEINDLFHSPSHEQAGQIHTNEQKHLACRTKLDGLRMTNGFILNISKKLFRPNVDLIVGLSGPENETARKTP